MVAARLIVTGLIVIVTVAVLGSLAYPSVQVPMYSTATLSNTTTNIISFASSTLVVAPYATSTVTSATYPNQNGNFPGCDPASMACNYGFVTPYYSYYTQTYSQLQTSFYQITATMQSVGTAESTQTNYQNIPMYASMGLGDSQFLLLSIVVIILAAAVILVAMKRLPKSPQTQQTQTKFICEKCGTELTSGDSFCTKCGAQMRK
ncbi:MAG TPA: zinc ribbon domain-containing protein [Candidatus Bathyarchaeia archaeon]|nr:zinc ribbon domain-containing protein [Candidatus Bathyarchaeia archaeon]